MLSESNGATPTGSMVSLANATLAPWKPIWPAAIFAACCDHEYALRAHNPRTLQGRKLLIDALDRLDQIARRALELDKPAGRPIDPKRMTGMSTMRDDPGDAPIIDVPPDQPTTTTANVPGPPGPA